MRVALFATCLADHFFADACADAVRLLRHLGAEVDFPIGQTCCGQPAHNTGHAADARQMAEHTLRVFRDADHVVLPSGSCAAMLRSVYPELLPGAETDDLAGRTWELTQFLVHVMRVSSLGRGLEGRTIAYHHGCHALRELGVESEPIGLLRGAGAEVLPWAADRECCGFGGLFSTKMPEVSGAMADRKLDTLPRVDVLTSTDGGCLLQLQGRAHFRTVRSGDPPVRPGRQSALRAVPPVRHVAHLLWEATGVA